ncbi:MAG: hypothetical protein WC054_05505 [Candidatus Nanopelagicales bacterium]
MSTGHSNYTIYIEDGQEVYPCRCGETHRGDYAIYDYGHHNCTHTAPLVNIDITDVLMCPQCGATFRVETQGGEGS